MLNFKGVVFFLLGVSKKRKFFGNQKAGSCGTTPVSPAVVVPVFSASWRRCDMTRPQSYGRFDGEHQVRTSMEISMGSHVSFIFMCDFTHIWGVETFIFLGFRVQG